MSYTWQSFIFMQNISFFYCLSWIWAPKLGAPKLVYWPQINSISGPVNYRNNDLNFFKNTMYMWTIPLIKLSNLEKRIILITHHHMPNMPHMCIMCTFCHMHVENLQKGPGYLLWILSPKKAFLESGSFF